MSLGYMPYPGRGNQVSFATIKYKEKKEDFFSSDEFQITGGDAACDEWRSSGTSKLLSRTCLRSHVSVLASDT